MIKQTLFYQKLAVLSLLTFFSIGILFAQTDYAFSGDHDVVIKGTSSLHDWESVVENVSGNASIDMADGTLQGIASLKAVFEVKSIKSGKGGMDKNTYEALNADKYPNITYTLSNVQSITPQGDNFQIKTRGNLSIAGATNAIDMTVTASPDGNGGIAFSGSKALKMTDFKVDPPTAMFGTIKTGDEITIEFTVNLKPGKM